MMKILISWRKEIDRKLNLSSGSKIKVIGLTLAAFVLANLLFSGIPLRLDFSAGQLYSLSPATKKILKNLSGNVDIKLFISSDLPVQLTPLKADIINLAREYDRRGRKRVAVTIKDPKKDAGAKSEADRFGIPELPFSQIAQDKYAVSTAYLGMVISYGRKTEIIPQAVNPASLEYDITAAIYKLTQKNPVTIGISGGALNTDQYVSLRTVLGQQFELEELNIASPSSSFTIDPQLKTTIWVDGGNIYGDKSITAVKKYLESGGNIILFADGMAVDDNLTASGAKHNLFDWLSGYGVRLNRDFVLSDANEVVRFNTPNGLIFTQYPFWVKSTFFDKKRPEFGNINQLLFPWASSMTIQNKQKATSLVTSSSRSWRRLGLNDLLPQSVVLPGQNELSTHNLIVEVKIDDKGKLLLIPSSRFIHDGFLGSRNDNLELVLNMVNTYASGGALSGIRSRAVDYSAIDEVDNKTKDLIKYLSIFLLPAVYGLWGVYRLFKRRTR